MIIAPGVTLTSLRYGSNSNFLSISGNPLDSTLKTDTFSTNFSFAYDTTALPFYSQAYKIVGQYVDPGNSTLQDFTIEIRLYFTPYNTLEVWDAADFYRLKRAWLHPGDSIPPRIYIHPDSIPESDLPDDTAAYEYEWQYEWDNIFIEGLGYAIPMMKDAEPVCINEAACNYSTADGCGLFYQRFRYTLQGNISEIFLNDQGDWSTLPYSALEIKFYENDLTRNVFTNVDDQYLGSTTIEDDGDYEYEFNICQSQITEGNNIEVYMVIKSYNPTWDIKAKNIIVLNINTGNLPFATYRSIVGPINLPSSPENTTIDFTRQVFEPFHRSVVYAGHVMEFINDNIDPGDMLYQWDGEINIWPNTPFPTSFFVPAELLYIVPVDPTPFPNDNRSAIHLTRGNTGNENAVYHEMGHFVMWMMQDKNWIDPITGSFSGWGWDEETNPRIAWTEGWADALSFICDLAHFNIDGECQFDRGQNIEEKLNGNNPVLNFQSGFLNPASVAAAIYDLYDGPNSYAAAEANADNFPFDDGLTATWGLGAEIDDVELTLQQICQPILDHAGVSGKIHDIDDYFRYLVAAMPCEQKREIKKVFDHNEILLDRALPNTGLAIDMIGEPVTLAFDVINWDIFNDVVNWEFSETFFLTDQDNLTQFHAGAIDAATTSYIATDLTLSDNDEFVIMNDYGLPTNAEPFFLEGPNTGENPEIGSVMNIDVCTGTEIAVFGSGELTLGSADGLSFGNMTFSGNSELELGNSISTGTGVLTINDGSTLTIDKDATLRIYPNFQIILNGPDAKIEIRGTLELMDNAEFTFTGGGEGSGFVEFNLEPEWDPSTGGEVPAHVLCHPGSSLNFTGDGTDDLVLRVVRESLAPKAVGGSPSLELFHLEDGRVELGDNARISTDAFLYMHSVIITDYDDPGNTNDGYHSFRGIHTYGQEMDINGVTIENGKIGWYNWNLAGNTLTFPNITFDNCGTGLRTIGGSVNINGTFSNNTTGWDARAMTSGSTIVPRIFNSNFGIWDRNSTAAAPLDIFYPNIYDNAIGVYFTGASDLTAWCGTIKDNSYAGIMCVPRNLHLSREVVSRGGYINLSGNDRSLIITKGYPYLNWGKNILNGDSWSLIGDEFPNNGWFGPTLDANNNYWDSHTNQPDWGVNYTYWAWSGSIGFQVSVIDNNPYPYSYYSSSCPQADGNWTPNTKLGTDYLINTTSFPSTELDDAIESTLSLMENDTVTGDKNSLSKWREILTFNYQNADSAVEYFLDLAYNRMNSALGHAVADSQVVVVRDSSAPQEVTDVLYVQKYLMDSTVVEDTASYFRKYRCALDLATTLRLAEEREDALTVLEGIQHWVYTQEQPEVDYWLCVMEFEQDVIDGRIPLISFDSIPCTWDSSGGESSVVNNIKRKVDGEDNDEFISVYPNPSHDYSYLNLILRENERIQVYLCDLNGKLIRKVFVGDLNRGDQEIRIDHSDLSPGNYILKVRLRKADYTAKINVIN